MPTPSLLQRLKERKLVQWALAYLAGAWVVVQLLDAVKDPLGLSPAIHQAILFLLAIGFLLTLVLAWYHGEKGRQRVSGPELLMVAALLVVAGVALSTLGSGSNPSYPETSTPAPSGDDRPGIAVLPLENHSPNPDDAFFADGMLEEITSKLSTISALRVISRSSVMQYREARPSSPQIARELNVDFLMEGSARLAGDRVRLTVQLIDAREDEHLWADDYDLDLSAENLFEAEAEVARQIAFGVGVNLTPEERDEVARVLTADTDAYLLYMQGNEAFIFERQRGQSRSTYPSIGLYERALELDPGFALAHARLALSLTYTSPDGDRDQRARREAELALSILQGLAEAKVAMSRYYSRVGRPEEAIRQFQAIGVDDPNNSFAIHEMGRLQRTLGEYHTGLRTLERAAELDPRNPLIQRSLFWSYLHSHRYDDALRAQATQVAVGMVRDDFDLAWIQLMSGEHDEALSTLSHIVSSSANDFFGTNPAYPMSVNRRLLTEEQHRVAFEVYREGFEAQCSTDPGFCARRALFEDAGGSPETGSVYWDSVRTVFEERQTLTWNEQATLTIAYEALGEKDASIRAAEALVSLDGAGTSGAVGSQFYHAPNARVLLARILAHFDEHARAIEILEKELPAPSWLSVPLLEIDPIWDPLRDHPRFQALLEKYRDDGVPRRR
jgi:serine/threonine-protein kinase